MLGLGDARAFCLRCKLLDDRLPLLRLSPHFAMAISFHLLALCSFPVSRSHISIYSLVFCPISKPQICSLQDADLFSSDSLVASSTPYQLLISVLPGATPRAWIHLHHNAQVCRRRYRGAGRLCRRLLAHGVSGTCWPGTNGPDCLSRSGFASHARYSRLVG